LSQPIVLKHPRDLEYRELTIAATSRISRHNALVCVNRQKQRHTEDPFHPRAPMRLAGVIAKPLRAARQLAMPRGSSIA